MTRSFSEPVAEQAAEQAEAQPAEGRRYRRFDRSQRISHLILLVSFTLLGITGLAQKYATSSLGAGTISLFGGIESIRIVHRSAAIVLMAVSIYHIVDVLYRVIVLRTSLSMLPVPQDFVHLFQDVMYYLGRRARKAYYGRYSYAEKMEYLAVVWGTAIMTITGFMMWNPIATTRWLPGESIPAAKAAHGGEALLAVLAIILWHFYHVHLRHFNRSIFTGYMGEAEMRHEHPAELDMLKSGAAGQPPPPEVVRRRERVFYPLAAVIILGLGYGLFRFATFEQTAIETLPRGERPPVFVPVTPTPAEAATRPDPTPLPAGEIDLVTWEEGIRTVLDNRCGACHFKGKLGNLSLSTYQSALAGGSRGPAIVPGNPQDSVLVQIMAAGGHPGMLTPEELQAVEEWIAAGAPER